MRPSHAARERRFQALLDAHGPALARLAGSYVPSRAERDDLFQEIALAVWNALPAFRGECSERTFVFRIAHNRGLSYLARARPPAASDAWPPARPWGALCDAGVQPRPVAGVVTAIIAAVAWWSRGLTRRELENLLALRRQIEAHPETEPSIG